MVPLTIPLARCYTLLALLVVSTVSATNSVGVEVVFQAKGGHGKGRVTLDQGGTGFNVQQTANNAMQLSSHSWEFGTTFQALLEVYDSNVSVYSTTAFPEGNLPSVSGDIAALKYVKPHISLSGDTLAPGDGANGDPASLGVGALLLGVEDKRYKQAANRQLKHVLQAPRFFNGAISQRDAVAELWADEMFMIPPFLAYYAVATSNETLLRQAVQQCGLIRQVLIANTTESWKGLWLHIVGPQAQTLGVWNTGNGWAALGMARVLATVKHWNKSAGWTKEQGDLTQWMMEIFQGLNGVAADSSTGMLKNYLVGSSDSQENDEVQWFGDGAGSAALVAAGLRLAVMDPSVAHPLLEDLDPIRKAVVSHVNSTGFITPTVNPLDWYTTKPFYNGSPEGQAFVAMMGAAWDDCVQAKVCQ